MEKEDINNDALKTLLQEPTIIDVEVLRKTFFHKIKLISTIKTFIISPICLGTLLKISKLLIKIKSDQIDLEADKIDDFDLIGIGIKSVAKNMDIIIKSIAYAIVNNSSEPGKKLLKFLEKNLTTLDAQRFMIIVLRMMNVRSFLALTVSMQKMNLMEIEKSITGKSSDQLLNTSDSQKTKFSGNGVGQI